MDKTVAPLIQAQFGLAHGWLRKGRIDLAVSHFERVLTLDPALEDPYLELSRLFTAQRRWAETIEICERGLVHFPNQSELHKLLIGAIGLLNGHETVLERYGLRRQDPDG